MAQPLSPEEEQELAEMEEMERLEKELGADTSPFPLKPKPLMMRGGMFTESGPQGPQIRDVRSQDDKDKAAQGIDVDFQMPAKESYAQSLATNQDERNAFVGSWLNGAFPDAPRRIADNGQIEFLHPGTKRWTEASPDAMAALGDMPELVFSTVLGGLGAAGGNAMGGPVGGAFGGSAGTAAGQLAGDITRQLMGKMYGLNQSQDLLSMAGEAVPEAALAGGLDLGFKGLYAAGRGVKTWFFGRQPLKPHEAAELLASQQNADTLVNKINKEVGGIFQPSTARRAAQYHSETGKVMLTAEGQASTDVSVGHRIKANQEKNERALDMYFDNTTLPHRMAGINSPSEGGAPLRQALDDQPFNATRQLTADKANAEDLAGAALQQMPLQASKGGAGRAVRGALNDVYQAAKKDTDVAYGNYKQIIGESNTKPSNIVVPWSREVTGLQQQLRDAIERSPRERSKDARKALLMNTDKEMNLSDLDDTIKDLRDDIRRGKQGKLDIPLNLREAKRLEKSLTNMRDNFLEQANPEAYSALMDAEKAQFKESNLFKYGLSRNLLVQDGPGRYKLSDATVVARILKNEDAGAAKEIADIVRGNPNAMSEAQNYLFAVYRRYVDPKQGLVPNYQRHKAFMTKYGPIVKEFFSPEQQSKLDELGGFSETIFENARRIKALNNAWSRDFGGKLRSFDAENLVESVNSDRFSVDEVRKLLQYSNAYGDDVTKAWRAGIAEDLRQRMFKGDHIDPARLEALVGDYDKMKKLSVVFGPRYAADLNILNDGMKMITRMGRDIEKFPKNTLFSDIARSTYAPQLTRAGKTVSLGINNRARSYMNKVYRALSDPEYLREMADRTAKTMRQMTGLSVASAAGYNLTDLDEYAH